MFRRKDRSQNRNDETTAPGGPRPRRFGRLRDALQRTRTGLTARITELFVRQRAVSGELVEEIEDLLLSADVGIAATTQIVADLSQRLARKQLADPEAVFNALRENMLGILEPVSLPLTVPNDGPRPFVVLMVGVNGTGKTTTIGKLASRLRAEGRNVLLAAGDTFRAAAIEQLQTWGERVGAPVIAQQIGADSASVVYDAVHSAKARGFDVLIADTAGRLHTQVNLMEELKKVRRVIGKLDPSAPHETLLVVDAGTGQNALAQARQFHQAVQVSGIALTKLDGTAKGGIVLAIARELALPIRFIGVGESAEDLRPFNASEFVDALFDR
ncbi:MAG: signal recognition particle-docking protein FtsY [Gammaproteobacteria bacterium]